MRVLFTSLCLIGSFSLAAQSVSLNPGLTPALFRYNDQVTVSYDVTGTTLANLSSAWIWVWIPGKNVNANYNVNPASNNTTLTDNAKFTKTTPSGKTIFSITFKPSDFFSVSISSETQLGVLLKGNDWSNGQTTDFITSFWDGSFQAKLVTPANLPLFVMNGDPVVVQAQVPVASDFQLFIDNVLTNSQTAQTIYNYTFNVAEISGAPTVKIVATSGASNSTVTFQYILSAPSPTQARPAGIIAGINYNADASKVTLCLWAPGKTSVYVQGDFSAWNVLPENRMNRDGEYFWVQLNGLTSGQEVGYRYLIDEKIYVADPFADKILDPDDQYIPAGTYPALKAFPSKALTNKWYFNRVAVFQTNQPAYPWQITNFQKPAQEKLVIYELLIRDFFGADSRRYQSLIDTLSYLKRLGVSAIELMPITEFNGNEGWGYNPTFMFAPDKYYGTKNKLKEFIDKCHQNGIAVIMDMVMNHHDLPNPMVLMDFDFVAGKPTVNNKWFNTDATHPYNVFFDMNHESSYTKKYLDTINYNWLHEYKVDGYRYDLSKGFTQKNTGSNVGAWGAYDASRIAILKRMADKIWSHTPDAYVILEHFADNTEEKELAEYRAGEGKGMMLWANFNNAYNQNTMGYASSSDISSMYYANRSWTVAHAVGYMESHDEERLMYKNLQFGNTLLDYSVKSLDKALIRIKGAGVVFYTIPGPKMLWEFGELGFDLSINRCGDGTVNSSCRTDAKPPQWQYRLDVIRKDLYNVTADLIRLRNTYSVFTSGDATITGGSGLIKQVALKNKPYVDVPANASQMNVVAVANFDVAKQTATISFPHTGTWYDYFASGVILNVTSVSFSMELQPGQYKLYTDIKINNPIVTALEIAPELEIEMTAYPNPADGVLKVESHGHEIESVMLVSMQGIKQRPGRIDATTWDINYFSPGLYVVEIKIQHAIIRKKIVKN